MSSYSATSYPHSPLHGHSSDDLPTPQHNIANVAAAAVAAVQPYEFDHKPQEAPQPLSYPLNHSSIPPPPQHPSTYDIRHTNGHGEAQSLPTESPVVRVPIPHPALSNDAQQKVNRLRKACDSCSARKVKCDEAGPPCRACAALDIPCTFQRPSRRRGPPNRHAEAIKRRRLEDELGLSSPASPSNAAATLASLSSHAVLSAESICPFDTLQLLVDDFFAYIHPLCPFPHEPSFRQAFYAREDLVSTRFLALLASMIAALVASFPRKPRLHLKAQGREQLFPNALSLVDRCHKVAVEARGAGYLDKELNVYDAATSYFLGLSAANTAQWTRSRLYMGETVTMARCLGLHKMKSPSYSLPATEQPITPSESGDGVDYIRQEIGRRVFWVLFVTIRSMQQIGAEFDELWIPPSTRRDPYPPLPLEVDDQYIFVDHVDSQPPGIVSELVGFNIGIKVYSSYASLVSMDLAYGADELFDFPLQQRVLEDCLTAARQVLDDAPAELLLRSRTSFGADALERQYYPPLQDLPDSQEVAAAQKAAIDEERADSSEARRQLQFELQKANIYASQLGTRSYLIEKHWDLLAAHENTRLDDQTSPELLDGDASNPEIGILEGQLATERENVIRDLMHTLATVSQVNIEPNGCSVVNKLRHVASTLLDAPARRKGPLARKAEAALAHFRGILTQLERVGGATSAPATAAAEEAELRSWAELRDCQAKVAQSSGFLL